MRMLSSKAYVILLLGDISILYLSVWLALVLRHLSIPSADIVGVHLVSFSLLFVIWFVVYFLAGLYGRYTVLFRKQLPDIIFASQAVNMVIAALFFFLVPFFAITPKTVLVLYLFVSTGLLLFWRVYMYPNLTVRREIGAVLIGTSQELTDLVEEVNRDPVYPLEFRAIIHPELAHDEETKKTLSRLIKSGSVSTIVADMGNHSLDKLLQFIYDITFVERTAEFLDVRRLYQEIFEKVPLSLIDDRWLLSYVSLSPHTIYDVFKRGTDIVLALVFGTFSLLLHPFIAFSIWFEDAPLNSSKDENKKASTGATFVFQERVGLGGRSISIAKLHICFVI